MTRIKVINQYSDGSFNELGQEEEETLKGRAVYTVRNLEDGAYLYIYAWLLYVPVPWLLWSL